ncbi:hypothetical protein AB0J72_23020 [Dactylosporangium sp. NPDC049742]|uniref:hypothetical protein n=1 Tax=Dactylosporangium sp. NPDC049742 TaxID=3154737 RepID=UPI003440619B
MRETFSGHGINGPWDMTADDDGESVDLFLTNVLNGIVGGVPATTNQGTVLRLELKIEGSKPPTLRKITTIGSGFTEKTDPNALIIGPTGVGLGKDGTLYVADTVANRIAAIPDADDRKTSAGTGRTITQNGHLSGPLGLAIAPNGNVLTVNGGDGNIVETNPCQKTQVAFRTLDDLGAGALFGLAIAPENLGVYFVDDTNKQARPAPLSRGSDHEHVRADHRGRCARAAQTSATRHRRVGDYSSALLMRRGGIRGGFR